MKKKKFACGLCGAWIYADTFPAKCKSCGHVCKSDPTPVPAWITKALREMREPKKKTDQLIVRQLDKDGKIKWQMVWEDKKVSPKKLEDVTEVIDEFLYDIKR